MHSGARSSWGGTLRSVGPSPHLIARAKLGPRYQNFVSERGIALQGSVKELSAAVLEKRRRRKQERDRKKRKRRELRAKEKAAAAPEAAEAAEPGPRVPGAETQAQPGLLFNKVSAKKKKNKVSVLRCRRAGGSGPPGQAGSSPQLAPPSPPRWR